MVFPRFRYSCLHCGVKVSISYTAFAVLFLVYVVFVKGFGYIWDSFLTDQNTMDLALETVSNPDRFSRNLFVFGLTALSLLLVLFFSDIRLMALVNPKISDENKE